METPFVYWPDLRPAPGDVMARLRELDPTLDLVHLGAGHWLLGSVQPNEQRRHFCLRILNRQYSMPASSRSAGRILCYALYADGFRPIAMYAETEVQNGACVRDFELREYNYRNRPEETFRARLREAEGEDALEKRIVAILDHVHSEWRSVHRYAMRHARSIRHPGLPWKR